VTFWQKDIDAKDACKMLMKLTTVLLIFNHHSQMIHSFEGFTGCEPRVKYFSSKIK